MNKFYILFLLYFIFSINLFCQEEIDSTTLSRITIINDKEDVYIETFNKEDLKNLNGSVAEAVQYFPGILINNYGGIAAMKNVNIRGMGSQSSGIFYDNISINNAQNNTIDLSKFSLNNLESITLYHGIEESLKTAKEYSYSSGIFLKSTEPKFYNKKRNLYINLFSGSSELFNPSFLWEEKISPTISSSLNIEYLYSNGKFKFKNNLFDSILIRKNADINSIRIEENIIGKIKEGEWKTKFYYYNSDRGLPGEVSISPYYHDERQKDRNFFIQGSYEKKLFQRYKIMFNSKYSYDYMYYSSVDNYGTFNYNTYKQQEVYLSLAQEIKIMDPWKLGISIDYLFNTLKTDTQLFVNPSRNTELIAVSSSYNKKFVSLSAYILGTFTQENIKGEKLKIKDNKIWTPGFSVSIYPLKNVSFYGYYKEIYRLPNFNDLYYPWIGNKDLKPEYTNSYVVGINYLKTNKNKLNILQFSIEFYYNTLKDKIIAHSKDNYLWEMENIGKVKSTGVNISTHMNLLITEKLKFSLRLNYSYQKAIDISSSTDPFYKNQIPYTPQNVGNILLGLNYNKWSLNYKYNYHGKYYSNQNNNPENKEKSFGINNLALIKDFYYNNIMIKGFVEINNLTNKQYQIIKNYPMPGRYYSIGIKVSI